MNAAHFAAAHALAVLPAGKGDATWLANDALRKQFIPAIFETLQMVGLSTLFAVIIGIIVLIPVTKAIVGRSTGSMAAVVPLVILSAPFFARLVETNLLAVDPGKIEAAQMMGASNRQIRWGVLIREAMPSLIQSVTTLAITLIGYSAMAGAVGGGGLGQMAINYGYNRWQTDVMISTVVAIIIIVQIIQLIGDILSRLVDHRAR